MGHNSIVHENRMESACQDPTDCLRSKRDFGFQTQKDYNISMKELDELFERVNRIEVSQRWYYDIGEYQYEQLKALAQKHPELQPAVAEALQMSHWYGPSYLIPIDLVPQPIAPKKISLATHDSDQEKQ